MLLTLNTNWIRRTKQTTEAVVRVDRTGETATEVAIHAYSRLPGAFRKEIARRVRITFIGRQARIRADNQQKMPEIYFWVGPLVSNPLCHAGGMKNNRTYRIPLHALNFPPSTIARFGAARLIKHFDGPYELVGGTPEERATAAEWCLLFAPEVVDFYTEACGPCRSLQPTLMEIESEQSGKLKIVKVNAAEESELASRFGVNNVPNLFLFRNGQCVAQRLGARSKKDLLAWIAQA